MASKQQQQHFVPLDQLPVGTGTTGRYVTDVTGRIIGIEPRGGTYKVTDRQTGEVIERPNSYTAHFDNGQMFSWPTYLDESGNVQMWSRFEAGLSLAEIITQGIEVHLWKDERSFTHLEVVQTTTVQQAASPMPPVAQTQDAYLPWN